METYNFIEGKIEAVTQPKEYQGALQIGFKIGASWYNITGLQEELEIVLKESIVKGNTVKFLFDPMTKNLKELSVTAVAEQGSDDGNWADDMIKFEDLLKAAHDKGIQSIDTEAINVDLDKKYALFKATVIMSGEDEIVLGKTFTAHGDATVENSQGNASKHWIRIAETRAIGRAFRWATNNAAVSDVEVNEGETESQEPEEVAKE